MNHSAYISAVPYKHKDSTEKMAFSPGTEIMGVHTDPQTCHRRQDEVLRDHKDCVDSMSTIGSFSASHANDLSSNWIYAPPSAVSFI